MSLLSKSAFLFILTSSLLTPIIADANNCLFRKAETRGWHDSDGIIGMDLRPQVANFGVAITTAAELHGTMYLPKSDGIKPYLAKKSSYDPVSNTLSITINQSCKWSDGHPIVAEDFVTGAQLLYSIDDEYLPSLDFIANGLDVQAGRKDFDSLGIKAKDTYTVEYTLNHPPEMAKHVLSLAPYAPLPTHKIKEMPNYWSEKVTDHVYSGPFKVADIIDQGIRLVRNPYFCEGWDLPVDNLEILFGQKIEKEGDLLLRNNVDLLGNLPARLRAALLKGSSIPEHGLINSDEAAVMYLSLNPRTAAFKDQRVRNALRLAYDVQQMESRRLGIIVRSADTFSYRYTGYNPPHFPWPEVPYQQATEHARQLMEQAGYSTEKPLKLKLTGYPLNEYQSIGAFLQSMYAQIHIDVEVLLEDEDAHLARVDDPEGDFDLQIYYWFADFPDPYNFLEAIHQNKFHSPNIEKAFLEKLKQAEMAKQYEKRLAYLAEAEQLLINDGYLLPAGVPVRTWLKRNSIRFDKAIRPTVRDLTHFDCS